MTLTLLFAGLSGIAMTLLFAFNPMMSLWWRLPVWLGIYIGLGILNILLGCRTYNFWKRVSNGRLFNFH